ncbi:hypothetical protein L2E82_48589 [Cichorium intybus]|uniref:Uncharacterized protein n=1 Tax=Cichorium intybus TaxID=13427 RepID=A0ACB8Z2N2_CICIN|nr:hypothetical protein L2E82_48589 [Cichorium intybus]
MEHFSPAYFNEELDVDSDASTSATDLKKQTIQKAQVNYYFFTNFVLRIHFVFTVRRNRSIFHVFVTGDHLTASVSGLKTNHQIGDGYCQLEVSAASSFTAKNGEQDGLQELQKIAVRIEENTYSAATSRVDYLRKISLKMQSMEPIPHNRMPAVQGY